MTMMPIIRMGTQAGAGVAGALVDLRAAPFGDEILGGEGHGEFSI